MAHEYVEEREGGLYVAGSRVSLASTIIGLQEGASPEMQERLEAARQRILLAQK